MKLLSIVLTIFCVFLNNKEAQSQLQFSNPILDQDSPDPAILHLNGFYYLTQSTNGAREITIYKSPILTSFREAEARVAFIAPDGFQSIWASEMHEINGELYIYFTMDGEGRSHFMYVIKADDPNEPMGTWSQATK